MIRLSSSRYRRSPRTRESAKQPMLVKSKFRIGYCWASPKHARSRLPLRGWICGRDIDKAVNVVGPAVQKNHRRTVGGTRANWLRPPRRGDEAAALRGLTTPRSAAPPSPPTARRGKDATSRAAPSREDHNFVMTTRRKNAPMSPTPLPASLTPLTAPSPLISPRQGDISIVHPRGTFLFCADKQGRASLRRHGSRLHQAERSTPKRGVTSGRPSLLE
jgi:hypothetical protein